MSLLSRPDLVERMDRIASVYLPNGNPAPRPKFDYKLGWFDRLISDADELLALNDPAVLAGIKCHSNRPGRDDALFRPEVRSALQCLIARAGLTLCGLHPGEWANAYTHFWKYFRNAFARDAGVRIDHLLVSPSLGSPH